VRNALNGGHLWALGDLSAIHSRVIPEDVERETRNILFMWKRLEESYDNLSQAEKDELAATANVSDVRFPGFDGNNESEHLSVAHFMMEHRDEFTSLKDRADHLDAHFRTLDEHRRMLGVFEPILEKIVNKDCSAAQIAEVMARARPRATRMPY